LSSREWNRRNGGSEGGNGDSRAGELELELEWWSLRPTASLTVSMTAMLGDWPWEMEFGRVVELFEAVGGGGLFLEVSLGMA
jgi:hypothetical protein